MAKVPFGALRHGNVAFHPTYGADHGSVRSVLRSNDIDTMLPSNSGHEPEYGYERQQHRRAVETKARGGFRQLSLDTSLSPHGAMSMVRIAAAKLTVEIVSRLDP